MAKKNVDFQIQLKTFFYSFAVLIVAGIFFDFLFTIVTEEGVFRHAIGLAKIALPGVSDLANLFLALFYAAIYAYLRHK